MTYTDIFDTLKTLQKTIRDENQRYTATAHIAFALATHAIMALLYIGYSIERHGKPDND